MLVADAFKAAVLLFLAVVVQATIMGSISILGGTPDLVLVLLLVIALQRGAIFGALGGFWAGFLLDTAYLGHARRHLAPAHAGRLLDRPLRRDDRP